MENCTSKIHIIFDVKILRRVFFVVLNNVTMHKCCTGVKSLLNSRYHNIVAFLHILG